MRLLHTSDWHLGQVFYGFERTHEHALFLEWLLATITKSQPDLLIIAGDVFDTANPPVSALRQFYGFLRDARACAPALHIVITAGNHDSGARLEAPSPILARLGVSVVGLLSRDAQGRVDLSQALIPIGHPQKKTDAALGWCVALPFLRPADLPRQPTGEHTYAQGVASVYQDALAQALACKGERDEPIIGVGHLHLHGGEVSAISERRLIVGGEEALPASVFSSAFSYVALGHLHKAQAVGRPEVRYSGSPLPLSFAEIQYRHQVVQVDFDGARLSALTPIEVPRPIQLLRVPEKHETLPAVLAALESLSLPDSQSAEQAFLEVRVALTQPEPALRQRIESALAERPVRLARIDVTYPQTRDTVHALPVHALEDMQRLCPKTVFAHAYESQYKEAVPAPLQAAFDELATHALLEERIG